MLPKKKLDRQQKQVSSDDENFSDPRRIEGSSSTIIDELI